jgi:hypothetical protein
MINESTSWGLRRCMTLAVVAALHVALIAALLLTSTALPLRGSSEPPLELLIPAPAIFPKPAPESARLKRLSVASAISVAAPIINAPTLSVSETSGAPGSGRHGSGIDWEAEAHRAIHAYEIRSHQPQDGISVSSTAADELWWRRLQHHPGEQFKTANGDWIVWIDSNCYQLATSGSNSLAGNTSAIRTICVYDPSPQH